MDNNERAMILLVEDEQGDADLIVDALRDRHFLHACCRVGTGEEALAYLEKCTVGELPDLILLDLNLPGISGKDVLRKIKTNQSITSVPVVIMTSSRSEDDILESYNNNCNCYISKPIDLADLERVVESIISFWFTTVSLPNFK